MAKTRVVTARLEEETAQQLDELVALFSEGSLEPVTPSMVLRRAIFQLWQEEKWAKEHEEERAELRKLREERDERLAETVRKRRQARKGKEESR